MRKALATATAALLLAALPFASSASAATVSNPGPVQITLDSGFLRIGSLPELTIDTPPVIQADVAGDGTISAGPGDVSFDQIVISTTVPLLGEVQYGVDIEALGAVTGEVDPLSGSVEIQLPVRSKITQVSGNSGASVGNSCYIGTAEAPIELRLDSETPGGAPFGYPTGVGSLADRTLTVPGQTGCTGPAGAALNSTFGLPAQSGESQVEFDATISPVLTAPPGVAIVSGPSSETDSKQAHFTFRSNLAPAPGFECRLDSGAWNDCSAGSANYTGLTLGQHTFEVRAVEGGSPTGHEAFRAWTVVEATGNVIARLTATPNPVGVGREITLDARSTVAPDGIRLCSQPETGPPSCGFQWDLDGDGSVDRVTNDPLTTTSRSVAGVSGAGVTVFGVGNASDAETTEFTVEPLPVASFRSAPPARTRSRSATFTFDLNGSPGASAECSLDGGDYFPCSSGLKVNVEQKAGQTRSHAFSVRGVSPSGVTGDPATHEWVVSTPFVVRGALAVFDGSRLRAEIRCARKFSPRCLSLRALAVTGKSRKAKAISTAARASLKAGKARKITLRIKPRFRKRVRAIAASGRKTLPVRAQVKFRKNGRLRQRQIVFTYRVALD